MRWRTSWLVPHVTPAATTMPSSAITITTAVLRFGAHEISLNSSVATAPPPSSRLASRASPPHPRASARASREPQPAAGRALASGATAVEALEYLALLAGGETGTTVAHLDPPAGA